MKSRLLKGQTLIEMIVVFFIISTALFATVTLILSNVGLQEQDADHTVAMNLAREALEMAQNKRDSNWLNNQPFDQGTLRDIPVADCDGVPTWNGTDFPDPAFDHDPDSIDESRVYFSEDATTGGMMTNVPSSKPTDFYRFIQFFPICQRKNDPTDKIVVEGNKCGCPPGAGYGQYQDKVGFRAKVNIKWIRKGSVKNMTVYGDFYDWR